LQCLNEKGGNLAGYQLRYVGVEALGEYVVRRGVGSQWVRVSAIVTGKTQEVGDCVLVSLDVLASQAVGAVGDQASKFARDHLNR
jgi:hypothetical protein